MGVDDVTERRAQLIADVERTSYELSRLVTEAISLSLPVWSEVRAMPAELSRWQTDLREIVPP